MPYHLQYIALIVHPDECDNQSARKMQLNKYFALSFLVLFGLLNWIYFAHGFSGHSPWWQDRKDAAEDRTAPRLLIVLSICAMLMMLTMGWVRETARAYNGYLIYGAMTFEEEGALYQPPAEKAHSKGAPGIDP